MRFGFGELTMQEFKHFGAVAGSGNELCLVVLDAAGQKVLERDFGRFDWREIQEKVAGFESLALAVEYMDWRPLNQLLTRGFVVYPVPVARLRPLIEALPDTESEGPAAGFATAIADGLRTSGGTWKTIGPQDATLPEIRRVWDREGTLQAELAAQAAELAEALESAFPALPEEIKSSNFALAQFALDFPGAPVFRRAKRHQVEKFVRDRLAPEGAGQATLALYERLQKSPMEENDHEFEAGVRRMAADMLRTSAEADRYHLLGAIALGLHPDYGYFGGVPEPAAGTGGETPAG